jgi:hypothetical protein
MMLVCGTEIAIAVREQLPNVFLSIVEAMSHVLTETHAARSTSSFLMTFPIYRHFPARPCCKTISF